MATILTCLLHDQTKTSDPLLWWLLVREDFKSIWLVQIEDFLILGKMENTQPLAELGLRLCWRQSR